ncbi:hypothetical protein SO486_00770 [Pseudomonas salmasensis]|uniref:Uncharacterized protein n=1 Tax=Pseudomonas salmasensis TaxID=2745514 RepID=A0ABU5FBA4_9PSED|nr:hypothetical protein [Pseudomonas salmasensis]MDY4298528.1 hypothetical protein [Pseudomonas salmasensis]
MDRFKYDAIDIEGDMEELEIEGIEIASIPNPVNFGILESDFGDND